MTDALAEPRVCRVAPTRSRGRGRRIGCGLRQLGQTRRSSSAKKPASEPTDPQHLALARTIRRAGDAAAELLTANSIAMLDALVDELCSAEVLEALLVADEIEAQRELVIDAMRDDVRPRW